MNARNKLRVEVVYALKVSGLLPENEMWKEADKLVDAFAHELAEQQRQHVRQMARDPFHYGSAAWAIRGADDVADLIDPMKEGTDG